MKLTPEQKTAYLENSSQCPYCKSDNITGEGHVYVGDNDGNKITCKNCGKQWIDIFTITGVMEVQ